jgi:hypothetical protein
LLKVKPSHPNAQSYNKTISDFESRLQNLAFQLVHETSFSFEVLKERLNERHKPSKNRKGTSCKEFAEQLIIDMLAINKAGNALVYRINLFWSMLKESLI